MVTAPGTPGGTQEGPRRDPSSPRAPQPPLVPGRSRVGPVWTRPRTLPVSKDFQLGFPVRDAGLQMSQHSGISAPGAPWTHAHVSLVGVHWWESFS